jgi:hypothetical protein
MSREPLHADAARHRAHLQFLTARNVHIDPHAGRRAPRTHPRHHPIAPTVNGPVRAKHVVPLANRMRRVARPWRPDTGGQVRRRSPVPQTATAPPPRLLHGLCNHFQCGAGRVSWAGLQLICDGESAAFVARRATLVSSRGIITVDYIVHNSWASVWPGGRASLPVTIGARSALALACWRQTREPS